jgi:hypothetical protein
MNNKSSLSKFLLCVETPSQSAKFIQLRSVILGLKIYVSQTHETVNKCTEIIEWKSAQIVMSQRYVGGCADG